MYADIPGTHLHLLQDLLKLFLVLDSIALLVESRCVFHVLISITGPVHNSNRHVVLYFISPLSVKKYFLTVLWNRAPHPNFSTPRLNSQGGVG